MLEPSIDSLQEKIDSKYTLVTLAARRARQIKDENNLQIENPKSVTYVGMALEEIHAGKVTVIDDE